MGRQVKEGSRTTRRANTKTATRKHCQGSTRYAARKAARTLQGKSRSNYVWLPAMSCDE